MKYSDALLRSSDPDQTIWKLLQEWIVNACWTNYLFYINAKIGLFLRPLTRGDQYVVRSGQVVCRSDYEKEFFLVQSFAAAAAASSGGGGGGTGGGSGLPAQSNLAPQVCSLTSLMFQSMFSRVKSIASSYTLLWKLKKNDNAKCRTPLTMEM